MIIEDKGIAMSHSVYPIILQPARVISFLRYITYLRKMSLETDSPCHMSCTQQRVEHDIERKVIVSIMVVWHGAYNGMDARVRSGLYNEALSVQSNPNHLEEKPL